MIHWVYPYGDRIAAPWSIGREVARGLRQAGHEVTQYDWDECRAIQPAPGDILLGHPHPEAGRVFRNSACGPWAKVTAMSPWNGSAEYTANLDYIMDWCDDVILICGEYWQAKAKPRTCVDMAVRPAHFPAIKRKFNPPGQRKLAYIGCTLPIKGPDKIAEVAKSHSVGHFGYGSIPGTISHGYLDFVKSDALAVLAGYDFLITLADHDANPTTVLEAMCWGLIPLCSPGSGYTEPDVVVVDSPDVIEYWQHAPAEELQRRQEQGHALVRTKYTWSRFNQTILEVVNAR